jgi:hypothetical protein
MRTKAKIEEEIAALATEVCELARRRGRLLPTIDDWGNLLVALGVTEEELRSALDSAKIDAGFFSGFVLRREVAPAAERLKEALLAVVPAAVSGDRATYYQAMRELRPLLADLLAQRASRWLHDWELREMMGPPVLAQQSQTREAVVTANVSRLRGWEIALWGGRALAASQREFWQHRWWRYGWGDYVREGREGDKRAGRPVHSTFEEEECKHLLPAEEAALVDTLPHPQTDEEWPDPEIRAWLPRLREWRAREAEPVAVTGDATDSQ